jgi:hypothetical protein
MDAKKLVEVAASYVGQREINGNLGFRDVDFEHKMKAVGWRKTDSWCCYFMEMVAKEAGASPAEWEAFDRLFTPSCTATYANFAGSKMFKVGKVPKPGALMVWRLGQGWKGHIGMVESVKGDVLITIEGNTDAAGGREGVEVARKRRRHVWTNGKGLNLVGYIYLC